MRVNADFLAVLVADFEIHIANAANLFGIERAETVYDVDYVYGGASDFVERLL